MSALAPSFEKCTVLTSVSERSAYEALRAVFQDLPRGDVQSKGVFKQCSGRRRGGKGRGARPATCQEGADAGIAVLVGLSGSALGLLRYGFAIASPRNDAIPNDSRDGHLPCEE